MLSSLVELVVLFDASAVPVKGKEGKWLVMSDYVIIRCFGG